MKQYMLLLLAIFFGCVACDDSNNEINIQPEATGSYTDVRDGNDIIGCVMPVWSG